jgi:uncharacterized protein (DUF2267 family)
MIATAELFDELRRGGSLPVGVDPTEATAAVVCGVLARLELEPARALLDALGPEAVQAIGRCPIHGGARGESFDADELLRRIASHFQLAPAAVQPMAAAVLDGIRRRVPREVDATLENHLPRRIVELWRGAGAP